MTNNINTLILSALKDKSLYGLEIIKNIQDETSGKLILKQPSLYSSLRRLETQGFVSSYWADSDLGGKRHYYNITPMGMEHLKKKLSVDEAEEDFFNDTAQQILKDDNEAEDEKEKEDDDNEKKASDFNNEQNIKQYSPTKNKGSFTDTMRTYVPPKNKYPEYELNSKKSDDSKTDNDAEEKSQSKEKEEDETIFPDIDYDLEFDDLLDGELSEEPEETESSQNQSDEINYKDILGDLLDEEEVTVQSSPAQVFSKPPKSELKDSKEKDGNRSEDDLKAINKSREYAKQYANVLTAKSPEEENRNPFEQKTSEPVNAYGIKLLEEISKRHKEHLADTQEPAGNEEQAMQPESGQPVESEMPANEIPAKTKIRRTPLSASVENTKYIFINKLKVFSQLFLSAVMLVEVAILFIIYLANNWIEIEQYILFGVSLFIIFILLIMRLIDYKRYPDKKIRKKINWGKNLAYRIIATVLLIVFVISINLLLGMNDFFRYDYLLRWLLPSLLITNIFTVWIINISLAHKVKYQI